MAVSHPVCFINCELGVNSGLIPIVIVIVIECHLLPLFFLKSGTLIFVLLGIIITDGCLHFAFALPSLWVRSAFAPKNGGKGYSKRDEIDLDVV